MTVDVNEAFAATKIEQLAVRREARDAAIAGIENKNEWLDGEIAAGRARLISENRVKVIQGFDRNEYFTLNRNAQGQIQEVVAEHGLDLKANGEVALFTSTPAWHQLGQVIKDGTADVQTVLKLAGLDYQVVVQPSYHVVNGEVRPSNLFCTVRDDTGEALGAVGQNYTVIDNYPAFRFLEELVGSGKIIWESAGSLRGGRRVFIATRLPEDLVVDEGGIKDIVRPFLVAFNSHDGSTSYKVAETPWRPVCGNTERFALDDATSTWSVRHTRNALANVEEARRTLVKTQKYYESWVEESTRLARTPMSAGQFNDFITELYPLGEEPKKAAITADENRREILLGLFTGDTVDNCRDTAYAARCAMTEFMDHVVPTRSRKGNSNITGMAARATRVLEDDLDKAKSRVHKQLLTLKTR